MSKITENAIEDFCIELLEKQGYEYIYAPDIASDLKKALSFYLDAGGKGDPTILQEQAVVLTERVKQNASIDQHLRQFSCY